VLRQPALPRALGPPRRPPMGAMPYTSWQFLLADLLGGIVLLLLFLDPSRDLGPVLALLGPALLLWGWGWWRSKAKQ
jgi:hypothetical protein